jgi:hypothetical protein
MQHISRVLMVVVALVSVLLPASGPAWSQQWSAPAASKMPPDRLRTQLKKTMSQSTCERKCRRPATTNDRINCCVFCFEAQWICNPGGGCFCEVPFNR